MKNGNLVISLDFELLWGVFDKVDPKEKKEYFNNTREIIPQILNLFNYYKISCTWATVGMLFNKDWEEWHKNKPSLQPDYSNKNLSAYKFGDRFCEEVNSVDFCFAPDIIKNIGSTPLQEIATHTYSHYYCNEPGQTLNAFKEDLITAIALANSMDINLKSLIFPRNQFNENYLKICQELGIENVRSNPQDWYWQDTVGKSMGKKIFRTGDAYMGFKNKSYSLDQIKPYKPIAQQASRFLRPYSPNKILNKLKLARIKSEMHLAAEKKEIYHLWWHPHNFGVYPQESLADLNDILEYFCMCRNKYGFQSTSMNEIGKVISG